MMICLILNLLLLSPTHVDQDVQTDNGKAPIVEWLTERDHDFQHLRQEHPKTFVFRFKNIDTPTHRPANGPHLLWLYGRYLDGSAHTARKHWGD
jgi:hypothetical protein